MAKITKFDRTNLGPMLDDLANHLKEFEREWGVRVSWNGGKFEPTVFKPRNFEIALAKVEGQKVIPLYKREETTWNMEARYVGLDVTWLGRLVSDNKRTYKVVGLSTKRRKKPVVLDFEGRAYYAPVNWLRVRMGAPLCPVNN